MPATGEWLPSSGFAWESGSDVERYLSRDMHAADSRSELWLPVVRAEARFRDS